MGFPVYWGNYGNGRIDLIQYIQTLFGVHQHTEPYSTFLLSPLTLILIFSLFSTTPLSFCFLSVFFLFLAAPSYFFLLYDSYAVPFLRASLSRHPTITHI